VRAGGVIIPDSNGLPTGYIEGPPGPPGIPGSTGPKVCSIIHGLVLNLLEQTE